MNIFVTGGTGYIGSRLIPDLVRRGHHVRALVRESSKTKLPADVEAIVGDALEMDSYTATIAPADTFVHLIGVPHPSPAKGAQFRAVDLVSIKVATKAAHDAEIRHFVYLSVAQPAPVMKAFIEVRQQGETMIRNSRMAATFVRPWYVLGPGHWWAYVTVPVYWILKRLPKTKEAAERLGLITIQQMLASLLWTIENPPTDVRILGVPEIRRISRD